MSVCSFEQRVALALTLALLPACPVLDEITNGDAPLEVAPHPEARMDPEAVDHKVRRSRACQSDLRETLETSWIRYKDQFDEQGAPRRNKKVLFLRSIEGSSFRRCDAITEGSIPPALPEVETVMTATIDAARHYADLVGELATYIDSQTSIGNGSVIPVDTHHQLRAAHGRWLESDEDLTRQLTRVSDNNDPKYLMLLRERGDRLEQTTRSFMVEARAIEQCLREHAKDSHKLCKPIFNRFAKIWTRFALHRSSQQEQADSIFWMSTFAADADAFQSLVRSLMSARRSSRRRSRVRRDLSERYRSLVRDANTLDFDFP